MSVTITFPYVKNNAGGQKCQSQGGGGAVKNKGRGGKRAHQRRLSSCTHRTCRRNWSRQLTKPEAIVNRTITPQTAVRRVEVDTIKKSINELQGRRPSRDEQSYEKSRTITFGKFPDDTKSERIIETIETVLKDFMHDIEDDGIFAYGKKFATMGAARFKTEEAMWKYLKKDSKSKCMKIDDYVLYVNRAEQGTSDDHARTKAVRKLVRAIIEEEGGGAQTKTKIDTNYRRGTVWYHDVRMGDFRDGQMMLTNNGARFNEKFRQLMQ